MTQLQKLQIWSSVREDFEGRFWNHELRGLGHLRVLSIGFEFQAERLWGLLASWRECTPLLEVVDVKNYCLQGSP